MGLRTRAWLSCAFAAAFSCCLSVAALAQSSTEAWQSVDEHRRLSAAEDTKFAEKSNSAFLEHGALMVENRGDYVVRTDICSVAPKRNALVFIRYRKGREHIFALLGGATVRLGAMAKPIRCGEELIVADHQAAPAELRADDYIGRRRVRLTYLEDGKSLGLSEFSLVHAVEREPVIYRLIHSSDPHDRALAGKVMKTAAVLLFVTGTHGQYIPRSN